VALAQTALTVDARELRVVVPVGRVGGVTVEDVQRTPVGMGKSRTVLV
jgi:hypothetical protein